MSTAPFTSRLMKWMLIFFVSFGASYLAFLSRGMLPQDILRASIPRVVLYSILGLISVAVLLLKIISGLIIFSLFCVHMKSVLRYSMKTLNKRTNLDYHYNDF